MEEYFGYEEVFNDFSVSLFYRIYERLLDKAEWDRRAPA